MDNTNERSTVTPTRKSSPNAPRPARKQSHAFVTGFTLFMVIGLMVLTAYMLQQIYQLSRTQSTQEEQLLELTQALKAKDLALETMQKKLSAESLAIKENMEKAITQTHYLNEDWLIQKARYILEMAAINTHWSRDYTTSISLFQEADQLLQQVSTNNVHEIRQAIANDIASMKAIPVIDIVGLLGQLDALQTSIGKLKLQHMGDNQTTKPVESESKNSEGWRASFAHSMSLLKQLVIVRRHDEAIQPLIDPLLESALKESLRLNLQTAQWAILNLNRPIYQSSLQQALKTAQKYFDPNDANTLALVQQIRSLEQIQLIEEKRPAYRALPLLNQLIEQKKARKEATSTQGE